MEDAAGLQGTAVGQVVAASAPDVVVVEDGELPSQPRRQRAEEPSGTSAAGEGCVPSIHQDQAPPVVPDQLDGLIGRAADRRQVGIVQLDGGEPDDGFEPRSLDGGVPSPGGGTGQPLGNEDLEPTYTS